MAAHSRWVLLTLRQSRIIWRDKQGKAVSARVEMENGRACVRSNNEGFGEKERTHHIMKVHYTSRAANIWGLAEVANCLPSCLSAIKASILFLLHSLSHIHPPWGEKGFGEFTVLKYVKWATAQIHCTLETPMKSMYVYINGQPICSLSLGGGNQARIFFRSQLLQMKWLQLTHHHCTSVFWYEETNCFFFQFYVN